MDYRVYESLLELVAEHSLPARQFGSVGLCSEDRTADNTQKLSRGHLLMAAASRLAENSCNSALPRANKPNRTSATRGIK